MADHVVMLTLSDEAYDYARRLAESSAQPIEMLIQQQIQEEISSRGLNANATPADTDAASYLRRKMRP